MSDNVVGVFALRIQTLLTEIDAPTNIANIVTEPLHSSFCIWRADGIGVEVM